MIPRLIWAGLAAVVVATGTLLKAGGLLMVGDAHGAKSEITETFNN